MYIGQTSQGVKTRFSQHMKPSTLKQRGSYKLYNAVNKYGKDKFYVEILESDLSSEQADEREVYYIHYYDSYHHGYNTTQGADEKTISSIQDVKLLKQMVEDNIPAVDIAKFFNINPVTVRRTMKSLNIQYLGKSITKEDLLKYKDDYTNDEIGKMFNVSGATISRKFKQYNIPRGKGCRNKFLPQNQKKGKC